MNPDHKPDVERMLQVSLARELAGDSKGGIPAKKESGATNPPTPDTSEPDDRADSSASSIVCATDFSEASAQAFEVAALFARRLCGPLVLVHAVDDESRQSLPGEIRDSLALYARAQCHSQYERLRELDVIGIEAFRSGRPDVVLLDEAANKNARLLVMGSARRTRVSRWMHGSTAERVAEAAKCPTLIVRNATPLLRWAREGRRLRVMLGADLSAPSETALRWVNWMRRLGPCDVFVSYFEPQPLALSPAGCPSPLVDELTAETTHKQEKLFRKAVRNALGRNAHISFEQGWSFSDAHLIQRAIKVRADIIVVGTHSRHGFVRFGHHSVSRGVIHYAPTNVVCVPEIEHAREEQIFTINSQSSNRRAMKTDTSLSAESDRPATTIFNSPDEAEPAPFQLHLKNILVPLDFSENSLKALRYAIPFARQFGATLTLLHVVELVAYTPELPNPAPLGSEQRDAVVARLLEIRSKEIPDDINVNTAVRHNFIFDGILEAAREIHADLIIATTHGRTGLMHMLLGSTAESIVRKGPCPVLVVRDVEDAS